MRDEVGQFRRSRPELDSASTASPGTIMPRSPCEASAGCTNSAGVPVEASVAAILRATWPDLPMPETTTRPVARPADRPRGRSCRPGRRRARAAPPPRCVSTLRGRHRRSDQAFGDGLSGHHARVGSRHRCVRPCMVQRGGRVKPVTNSRQKSCQGSRRNGLSARKCRARS